MDSSQKDTPPSPKSAPSPSRSSSQRSESPSSEPDPEMNAARLRAIAQEAHVHRVPYAEDGSEHFELFSRALHNVLSTELALFTFAHIIDGLPTADVAWDTRFPNLHSEHPIEQHETLCPGVFERARSFRQSFDPAVLSFDPKLLRSFRRAPVRSRQFNIRLIELVAISMHEIGALLFQLDLRMHAGDITSVDQWVETPPEGRCQPIPPKPTLFYHHAYFDYDICPQGVADMVGYWAENRVLGGATVFDRAAEANTPLFPPNVCFNSCRRPVTYRYCQLRDEQQDSLLDFLLAENPDVSQSPLPILADNRNVIRVNEEDAIFRGLYRDIWERKPPTRQYLEAYVGKSRSTLDYPEFEDYINYINTNFGTVDVRIPFYPPGDDTEQRQSGEGDPKAAKGQGRPDCREPNG